jgi:antitoxin YefM
LIDFPDLNPYPPIEAALPDRARHASNVGSKNNPCSTNVKTYAFPMKTISATLARSDLYRVIDSALEEHEPVQITGKRGNVILVSESDWRAIQETLYLVSIPGMRDSIRAGMAESIGNCSKEVDL